MKTYSAQDMRATTKVLLVYGESGVGKTRFACTAQFYEPLSPCLLAAVGTESEQAVSVREYSGLTVVELESLQDVENLKEFFVTGQPVEEQPKGADWPVFKSLVFDGLTELQLMVMVQKLGLEEKGRTIMTSSLARLPPAAVQRDWGTSFNYMINVARVFAKQVPVPVIFTALERYYEDKHTGSISIGIGVPGQPSNILPSKATATMRLIKRRTFGVTPSDWRLLLEEYEKGGDAEPLENVGLLYSDGKFKAINRLGPKRFIFNPTVERFMLQAPAPDVNLKGD
jgi:hypothetical protein